MDDIRAIAFGSFYENGEFCKPQSKFSEGPIEFLDSTLGAIGWNRVNGVFYCRDVYCMGITWEELRSMGYVYGRLSRRVALRKAVDVAEQDAAVPVRDFAQEQVARVVEAVFDETLHFGCIHAHIIAIFAQN